MLAMRKDTSDSVESLEEMFDALARSTGKVVWRVSRDSSNNIKVDWRSDNTPESLLSRESLPMVNGLLFFIDKLTLNSLDTPTTYNCCGKDYEVVCSLIDKNNRGKGYIITLSRCIRTRILGLLDKQKIRNEKLCTTMLLPLPHY